MLAENFNELETMKAARDEADKANSCQYEPRDPDPYKQYYWLSVFA